MGLVVFANLAQSTDRPIKWHTSQAHDEREAGRGADLATLWSNIGSCKEQVPEFFGIQGHQVPETVGGISGSDQLQSFRGCYPGTPPASARHVDVQRRHVTSVGLGLCNRWRDDRQQAERFLDDPSNSVCQG